MLHTVTLTLLYSGNTPPAVRSFINAYLDLGDKTPHGPQIQNQAHDFSLLTFGGKIGDRILLSA